MLFLLAACGDSGGGDGGNWQAVPQEIDCLAGSVDCPELVIDGDAPDELPGGGLSEFHGFADPTIRKDPDSDRIWMAYSWPNVHVVGLRHVPGVDTHLAYSDDDGLTWQFHRVLWPSEAALDLSGSLEAGYIDHEVPNLLPRITASGTIWYGIRLNYFVSNTGGFPTPVVTRHAKAAASAWLSCRPTLHRNWQVPTLRCSAAHTPIQTGG
jgi:hypothetical protein